MPARLDRITLYPIKSLDGVEVPEARVLANGALENDRRYALLDRHGNFLNGKANARVHRLRARFGAGFEEVELAVDGESPPQRFHLEADRESLEGWLAAYFDQPVRLGENREEGFGDDQENPGATLMSSATYEAVAGWFPRLGVEELRRRFRTNLDLGEVPAFWEDHLVAPRGQNIRFRIGEVVFEGANPCQRCVVLSRDSRTGETGADFARQFIRNRQATLPLWAPRSRFDHFHRMAVNTCRPSASPGPTTLRPGDPVEILGLVPAD
ncbi:MAG TPA: MOSC N-terminal beta barrel domain-containing protein [Thermoanaerobaculia bacterium]|nr:MOSC N-terminal beta barrel domain-containing protein [Thermoanaerobaculia bacterium]